MARKFLTIYGIIIASVTILFLIFGERKDPRYYITMLILAINNMLSIQPNGGKCQTDRCRGKGY